MISTVSVGGRRYALSCRMLSRKSVLAIVVFSLTLCCVNTEQAVAHPDTVSYWAGVGLGPIAMSDLHDVGFGGSGRFAFSWSKSVISLSASGGGTLRIFGTNDEATMLNVCYGLLAFANDWMFRFSAGPAYLNRVRRSSSLFGGSSTELNISEIGVSVETEVMFQYKLLGIGFVLAGALSEEISALLLTANVSLGNWHR